MKNNTSRHLALRARAAVWALTIALLFAGPVGAQQPNAQQGDSKPSAADPAAQKPATDSTDTTQTDTTQTPAEEPADSGEPKPYRIGDFDVTGAIELDWRFTGLDGNRDYYRSQVDLQQGPTLAFSRIQLRSPDNTGAVFDDLLVEGSGWGGEPNSSARVRASMRGVYLVDYTNRHVDTYNFIPDFANPLFQQGVLVAPHGWDRSRNMQSVNLSIFPERKIEGHFAYDYNRQSGLGLGTTLDSETLILNRDLDNTSHEVRGGVALRWPRWYLWLEHGGRFYDDDETSVADPTTVDPETLASFSRRRTTDWTSPTTRASFTAEPIDDLKVTGRFVYSDYDVDATFLEQFDAEGSDPLVNDTRGRTDGQAVMADSLQSYRFLDRFTVSNFLRYRRYRNSGSTLGSFVFNGDTANAIGETDVRSVRVETISDEPQIEVEAIRGLFLRASYRFATRESFQDKLDTVLVPGLDPIVDTSHREEDYRADVFLASGSYRYRHQARFYFEYENGRDPSTFFERSNGVAFFDRAGDYQLLRVRGMVKPKDWMEIGGSVRTTDRTFHSGPLDDLFDEDGIASRLFGAERRGGTGTIVPPGFDPPLQQSRTRAASFTFRVTPEPRLMLGLTYDRVHNTAGITFQRAVARPDGSFRYETAFQRYLDDENLVTADFTAYPHWRVTLSGFYSLVSASGTLPVHYHQTQIRGVCQIGRGISGVAEWRLYDYDDHRYSFDDYQANHAVVGVRWEW